MEQLQRGWGLLPENHGQNPALTVSYVPCPLDRGLFAWCEQDMGGYFECEDTVKSHIRVKLPECCLVRRRFRVLGDCLGAGTTSQVVHGGTPPKIVPVLGR